jgi:dTDP-4-dehydrorhamnose reductase
VRVCRSGLLGPLSLLTQAYARLRLPFAITEAHLAGVPEDRARWFSYIWNQAEAACGAGMPIVAVTAWALLGSYGWDRLVTRGACSYEAGAFEVRGGRLTETPYAGFLRAIARGSSRVVDGGWWQSDERVLYPHGDVVPQGTRHLSRGALAVAAELEGAPESEPAVPHSAVDVALGVCGAQEPEVPRM